MVTGSRVCEYHRLLFHTHLLIIFFSKHRIWILFSLFCFFCLFFFFLCLLFLPLLLFFLFFKFVFLFFFLLLLIFLYHFYGRPLKGWPRMRGVTFSWMRRCVTFSFVPCVFSVVCFKYFVKLSSVCVLLLSVCVDLLQVPGLTALA